MKLEVGGRAPYAPGTAIIGLLERHRASGLRAPVNADYVGRLGVTDSLAPRTVQTMRDLGFIDESDAPTEVLESFKRGSDADFREALADHLEEVYEEVFHAADPRRGASFEDVETAFRAYEPGGQRARMVSLFFALCEYTGIVEEAPKATPGPKKRLVKRRATVKSVSSAGEAKESDSAVASPSNGVDQATAAPTSSPLLAAFFETLPAAGSTWPRRQREVWMAALDGLLNVVYTDGEVEE